MYPYRSPKNTLLYCLRLSKLLAINRTFMFRAMTLFTLSLSPLRRTNVSRHVSTPQPTPLLSDTNEHFTHSDFYEWARRKEIRSPMRMERLRRLVGACVLSGDNWMWLFIAIFGVMGVGGFGIF